LGLDCCCKHGALAFLQIGRETVDIDNEIETLVFGLASHKWVWVWVVLLFTCMGIGVGVGEAFFLALDARD
jgi:hypothetical protein